MCSASQSPPRIWGAVISNLLLVLCRSCLTLKIFLLPRFRFRLGPRADRQHVQKKKKINEKEMRSIFYPFTAAHFLFLWIEGGGGAERGEGGSCFQDAIEKEKWKRQTAALLLNQCDFRSDGGLGGCILARNKGQWGPAEQRRSGTHEAHSRYLQVSFSEL